jgi:mRNA interferase MazF
VLPLARITGLYQDSIANISQLLTVDKRFLTERVGKVPPACLQQIEAGGRLILNL